MHAQKKKDKNNIAMKRISLVLTFVLAVVLGNAQPKIQFSKTTYDFGTIKEEGGKVTGRFDFTNVGDSTLILTNVRPGCGCTAANYTKTPIEPGQQGFIDATYDPYNRPGTFNKNVKVTTNEPQFRDAKAQPHLIFIKGTVTKRPPTVFEVAGYKNGSGMVRFKEASKQIDIKNTESHTDTFLVKNFWTKNVSIEPSGLPAYISEVSRSFGKELKPNEEGYIVFKYDASQRSAFGVVKDGITILTNDSIEPKKRIHFSVNISEDFSKLTEKDLKNAPVCKVSLTQIEMGQIAKNGVVNKEVVVSNNGKSPLIVRSLNSSLSSLVVKMDKMSIEPGQTATLSLSYNSKNRRGKQNASVDIITNDPANSRISITVSGEVLP